MTQFDPTTLPPFAHRHIGPSVDDVKTMLDALGHQSLEGFIEHVVPAPIFDTDLSNLPAPLSEEDALAQLRSIAAMNHTKVNVIGQGYYGTYTPEVIRRNVLENPSWYTAYTPYQPEISQGRLEVLFNFQTMITELTGLDVANASLLDEATACAEAIALAHRATRGKFSTCYISKYLLEASKSVIRTRAQPLEINVVEFDEDNDSPDFTDAFAVIVQYPRANGDVVDYAAISTSIHAAGGLMICAADLLALTLIEPPSAFACDIAVGSAQRFGVPLGFGGPHAAYMAVIDKYKRNMPGRLVGQSIDVDGNPCYRLALQTREQHIRREKATSNICTAQALLAIMATLYATYHGPLGIQRIAQDVHRKTRALAKALEGAPLTVATQQPFDTLVLHTPNADSVIAEALSAGFNVARIGEDSIGISIDETITLDTLNALSAVLGGAKIDDYAAIEIAAYAQRTPTYLSQEAFNSYHNETAMMRYLRLLASKDIALDQAMIPLGSCTMKLNAASEMAPITWPEFANIHPFAPADQRAGYDRLIDDLNTWLSEITGYAAVSFQPNAGSQGEYAGLLAIMRYHQANGDTSRNICLIPQSAHGTNPASAHMCGMQVIGVATDNHGNIDLTDLDAKIAEYGEHLAAIMLTYPSTHGVYEDGLPEVCERIHASGGQVYIDGANMNALVGLAKPGHVGGDVSHLNLHKTFCIPHGGGGPGVGPIGVAEHLVPFLPGHHVLGDDTNAVSAAPWGSASILPITWMYLRMMGEHGLRYATAVAIVSANYIVHRLKDHFPVLYTDDNGHVAHECILDTRILKEHASVDDIAKRLIDYGFHAPTMSFPVAGTLMVEPTESEPFSEIERFVDAMQRIYKEYSAIANGTFPADDNPLVNAPHTATRLLSNEWLSPYTRQQAAYPAGNSQIATKYWPPIGRVDNVYGDKNLICTCPPVDAYT